MKIDWKKAKDKVESIESEFYYQLQINARTILLLMLVVITYIYYRMLSLMLATRGITIDDKSFGLGIVFGIMTTIMVVSIFQFSRLIMRM
jgi:hypothetical protein